MHYSSTGLRSSLSLTTLMGITASGWTVAQNTLEEILVTAQKRVENVQDIPVTINVLTGDILDNFSIRDTNDLAASVPGLTIQHTPQNLSQVTMRGIGTGAGGESLDQSVGLFIDGVWAGRIREFQAALFDVERVEVIKGTQTAGPGIIFRLRLSSLWWPDRACWHCDGGKFESAAHYCVTGALQILKNKGWPRASAFTGASPRQ